MKSSARFALFLAALWLIAPLAKAQDDSDDAAGQRNIDGRGFGQPKRTTLGVWILWRTS